MAGQRQKHPDDLAFKRGGRYQPLVVVGGTDVQPPALPKGASSAVRSMWRELWGSSLAGAFKPTDVPTLQRWAWWLDQWFRVSAEVASDPLLVQSRTGYALNPKTRYLKQCESSLRELEKAFGMDTLARLRLGLTLVEEQSALQKLKQPAQPRALP